MAGFWRPTIGVTWWYRFNIDSSPDSGYNLRVTTRERFYACMEYESIDRVPNHEVGVWGQTRDRWQREGLDVDSWHWDWFTGEPSLGMDCREYIPVNFGMIPEFEYEILEETDRHEGFRDRGGSVRKARKEGAVFTLFPRPP